MQTAFTEELPVAHVRGGIVFIVLKGGAHPAVAAPLHIVRRFCECTIRTINEFEAEQAGRIVPMRKRPAHS